MATLVLAVVAAPSHAIILHAWTFEELAAASDAVLVVQHLASRDTGRRTPWPVPGSRFTATLRLEGVEWESDLKVLLQLKPPVGTNLRVPPQVRLRYYRVDDPAHTVINVPAEIDFSLDKGPYYLVFLRHVSADLFDPASKDDTPIDSVFSLQHTGARPIQWELYLPAPPPRE